RRGDGRSAHAGDDGRRIPALRLQAHGLRRLPHAGGAVNRQLEPAMARQIFINLPVADLARAIAFFSALGFGFNSRWADDSATCMVVGDDIFVMLLKRTRFQSFTPKPVADATATTE